nr:DUF3795 domain-containing protein [Bacteroidota bacterium]
MEKLISCCGLNCATCDARIATVNNDDALRAATAETWSKMYGAKDLTAESINCMGCREEGVKFAHCEMCEIRKCVHSKGYETCGECSEMDGCKIVAFVHDNVPEAIDNLRSLN